MGVKPSEHPVLLTEPPLTTTASRERLTKIMFDTFNVPAIYVAVDSVLALYASGSRTGCVVHSGFATTTCIVVQDGFYVHHYSKQIPMGGRDLTEFMRETLREVEADSGIARSERIFAEDTGAVFLAANEIKERICSVALNPELSPPPFYDPHAMPARPVAISHPSISGISLSNERVLCPEILFKPSLYYREHGGIHQCTFEAIMNVEDDDFRCQLFGNIIMTGGNTMFSGIAERMTQELNALAPNAKILVSAPPDRKYAAWIGGSLLGQVMQESLWITRARYDEYGAGIVRHGF